MSLRPLTVFLCATVLAIAVAGAVAWLVDSPAPPLVSTIELQPTEAGALQSRSAGRDSRERRGAPGADRRRTDRTQSSSSKRGNAPTERPHGTTPAPSTSAPAPTRTRPSGSDGGFAPPAGDDDDEDPDADDDRFDGADPDVDDGLDEDRRLDR